MLGILLSNPSEETVKNISSLSNRGVSYCVFSPYALPEETKSIPHLQPLRAYNFKGTLIATDIRTARFAVHLALPRKKFFYITSMEWTESPQIVYEDLKHIYLNDDMDLIVSNSKDHKIISNLFKEPKYIIEDWNFKDLPNEYQE